ncbi:MAG: hypothetical protein KC458_00600 [Dehalococcoidia bacterium]|nr:hypothetical protein [Dehalococcoidia bacterium]
MTTGNPEGFADAAEEFAFLRAYESVTLWKPQVVADNVLTGIFLADATYRGALAALLLQESVEAVRRLTAVWHALADRSEAPARRLRRPLPLADDVQRMADTVGKAEEAREVVTHLGVGNAGADSAAEIITFGGLSWFAEAARCAESGPPDVTVVPPEEPGGFPRLLWSGFDHEGTPRRVEIELEDSQVIALGDATGDFVTWAREFLAAYIDARAGGAA